MAALDHISLNILLRDDIWSRIVSEASHVTKSITITWDARSLLHLVIRRALHNTAIQEFYSVDSDKVLADEQKRAFYRIFPV